MVLGLADINTITKGGCVSCNGICLKTFRGGLFIHGGGFYLGTQNAGAGIVSVSGIVSGNGLFFRTKAPMMTSFMEFVGALFNDIQPLSNFDIIRICNKLKISNFEGCFMRDEIGNLYAVSKNCECFIMILDDSNSYGTHWIAVNIVRGTTYYFDSFGFPLTEEIKEIL